ncbi:type II toxin-antitoxin system Phd/YefM family antitoxin [Candidatus Woesebacteria bacterium]|nr:type II toxin-antitoxin system Phd/YefM family antitoxin [Candidatus Woesebacteria bacterium]
MIIQSSIPVRDILRNYKAIFSQINKSGKGVVVVRNNEPEVAIIPISQYEKMQLETLRNEAIEEYEAGKTKSIETDADWNKYEKEVLEEAL